MAVMDAYCIRFYPSLSVFWTRTDRPVVSGRGSSDRSGSSPDMENEEFFSMNIFNMALSL